LTKPARALQTGMQPLYLTRIEDLGHGDLVEVDCAAFAACHHVALLTPDFLLRLGLDPWAQGARPNGTRLVPRVGAKGRAVVSVKWGRQNR
jgi:hypothetical protein